MKEEGKNRKLKGNFIRNNEMIMRYDPVFYEVFSGFLCSFHEVKSAEITLDFPRPSEKVYEKRPYIVR